MHGNTINSTSINSESTRVREIYPQYLRDTATNVISFLEEYYDYMNRVGYPSYEVDHVVSENDIDQTSEKYLDAIQGEIAKIVPNSAVVDRNTLYKRIVHYYKIKGTPDSIDVFFKIFFDSLAELYYPNKDLFKLSEGDFAQEIKYFIDSNVKYSADNSLELLTPNELSIVPSNQPVLGDDFIISFTALLNNDQLNDDAYVFTTTDYLPTLDEPGLFDLRRDTSGTYLAIQQSGYVGGATTLRFDSDIFNDEWTNVRIEYSANADDIAITETDATHVTVDGAGAYTNLNGSYTKSNGTLWENGTADYSAAEVTAFIEYPISELIDGQKYKITSAGTTDFTALGATDSNVGTIFTYNNITSEYNTTGKVKHRLPVWHLIDNGTIRYIDANTGSYHAGGAVAGSNRVPVSSAAAISSISFIDYSTLQSVQTAKVKAYSNGNIVLNETIKHNRGYFNATENFSIFSKNTSVANTFDCRGRLAAFRIEGALSNNFDYRFTSLDAASNNALRDWSGSGNDGSIVIPPLPLDASSLILSLRNVDPNYTGSVVEVRRSSDDAEESFTAAEVANSTLLNWVNADVDITDRLIVPANEGTHYVVTSSTDSSNYTASVNNTSGVTIFPEMQSGLFQEGRYKLTGTIEVTGLTGQIFIQTNGGSAVATVNTELSEGTNNLDFEFDIIGDGSTTSAGATRLYWMALIGASATSIVSSNLTWQVISADGTVSKWYDQSGDGNHATQATAGSQPKIVDGGVLVTDRDGKVALNGKGAKLNLPNDAPMLSADGTYSLFAVVDFDDQRNGNDTFNNILRFDSKTNGGASSTRKPLIYLAQSDGSAVSTGPSFNSGSVFIPSAEVPSVQLFSTIANPAFSTGNNTVYADGVLVGSANSATDVNTDTLLSANSQIFDDQETTVTHFLSEVIYYPSDQLGNRLAIEANIANAYGISGSFGTAADPSPYNWSWNNDQSSYGPLPTSIHPLPEVTSYQDRGGFPSSEKKIQDSKFWQDYSYQISTKVAPELWRESYSRLVHPAGMKFFVLLLIEIVNRSTWTELLSYTSSNENPESWYNALVPPAKRLQDPSEGYHTPRYQPGWLNSAQIAIVLAIAELQYASPDVDPYVNNFVETANSSSITRMNNFSNRSREGFTSAHNVAHTIFGVAGFPLTRILKEGERIRFKFNYTTGANSTPIVTLLKNRNSANASGVIATLGNGVEIINDVAQAAAGHTLSANQTRVSVDITLESQDDCVQFIAFIDEAGTTGKSLSVDGFEIVDVDRSDYPLVVGGDSLSVIASATARYNRNQNFERSVVFDSVIAITPFNYRSKYIHDEYVTGVLGSRNPTFWFDQNDLSDMGYLNFSISGLSLTYEEGIESQSIQANISSPQRVEIVTSTP